MKLIRSIALLVCTLVILLAGCRQPLWEVTPKLNATAHDKVLVSFIRPSIWAKANLYQIWDGEAFVGLSSGGKITQYYADPGKHVFMAYSGNWSYVQADLLPGKNYYILVHSVFGMTRSRVAFDPVRRGDESAAKVDEWMNNLDSIRVVPSQEASFVAPRAKAVKAALAAYEEGKVKYEILAPGDYLEQ